MITGTWKLGQIVDDLRAMLKRSFRNDSAELLVIPALRLRRMCAEQAETSENLAARDSHERTYFRPDFGRKLDLRRFVQVTPPGNRVRIPSFPFADDAGGSVSQPSDAWIARSRR